ncbi:MAG: multidrug effflux MFS transporter [Pseudomonadota bacterium]
MLRLAVILGLLSAVGPFAIDMYLPAMPAIASDLFVDPAAVQGTLIAYFVGFGLAQLVYGPWSDQAGRKLPLFVGLALFAAASVGCALAQTVEGLMAYRMLQGLGGAVLLIVPRAVIRDLYTGPDAMRLMALVMLVVSVSPMIAPLVGSGLMAFGPWSLIFWALALAAAASLGVTATLLPETLDRQNRSPINLRQLLKDALFLLRDPVFMGLTLIGGFGFGSFMVFIASASFVYSGQFGLSPTGFSLAFAVNALGFFAASQLAAPLGARLGPVPVIRFAVAGFAAATLMLLAATAAGWGTLPIIIAGLFLANACLGLVIPTTMVMALDPHGQIAGLASSLGGTLQMLTGGMMVALSGLLFDGTALPMIAAIAACAVLTFCVALPTLRSLTNAVTHGH